MKILAGDVGADKTHVGLFDAAQSAPSRDAPRLLTWRTYRSADYQSLGALLDAFMADVGPGTELLAAASFGVAGPVIGRCVVSDRLPWEVDATAIGGRFAIPQVGLVNDLVATAEGLSALGQDELLTLNLGFVAPGQRRPCAMIAAGTGLGMALLVPSGSGFRPWPSEGGHADFAPRNAEEAALLAFAQRREAGHTSIEHIVSAAGIRLLYDFARAQAPGVPERESVRRDITDGRGAAAISEAALAGECPLASHALRLFVDCYAAAAANLVLTGLATEGLYVAGSIAPTILSLLERRFMAAFTAKGRLTGMLQQVPVHVVANRDAAFLGAARLARRAARAAVGVELGGS